MVEKGLYGSTCIAATEKEKKSNFADQLKLLQKNAEKASQQSSENGDVGEKKEFDSIFGDVYKRQLLKFLEIQIYSKTLVGLIQKRQKKTNAQLCI